MARKIFIFDTTLRDGEQSPGASMDMEEKLEIAQQLKRLNVDVIEAGFPFSSNGDFEAVQMIASEVKGPYICALARALLEDIECAWQAIGCAEKPILHTFIGTSPYQLNDVLRKSKEEVLKMAVDAVQYAKSLCHEVEFSAMDASRTDLGYLYEIVQAAISAGATIINVPDTAGYAVPEQFGQLIHSIFKNVSDINKVRVSVHCHDDLGLATASSIAAIKAGATQVECAVNGMGERAGNAALEEVVMAIKTRGDYLDAYTDVKTQEIINTSRLVSRLSGFLVPPNKPIVGSNAFSHSSGIHQDGVLKKRSTFEIMRPEDVGLSESEIVLTASSGRHALRHRLAELGYELTDEKLREVYQIFLTLAEKKKQIYDDDLRFMMSGEASNKDQDIYNLDFVHYSGGECLGEPELISARVMMSTSSRKDLLNIAFGDGPVDAVCKAINEITGARVEMTEFSLQSISKGPSAIATVIVRIRDNGNIITGQGASTDIVVASAKAYVNAINRLLVLWKREKEDERETREGI